MTASNAPKRTLRDIWPHLVVSACALLLPPLGMAAGVVYLGSPHQHEIAVSGPAEHAAVAVAAEPAKASDPVASRTDVTPNVANAVPSPAEQRAAAEPQVVAPPAPAPAAAPAPASIKDAGTKDTAGSKDAASTRDVAAAKDAATKDAAPGAASPAAAKIGETSESNARAEATPPAETADTPAAPANAQQSGQKSRHDSRGRVRQARVPSITDIFGVHRYR